MEMELEEVLMMAIARRGDGAGDEVGDVMMEMRIVHNSWNLCVDRQIFNSKFLQENMINLLDETLTISITLLLEHT